MRIIVQKVKNASVKIDDVIISSINNGLLLLVAIKNGDNQSLFKWMSNKLINLRIFPDINGKMNKSVLDINGEILVVSNFTLYGDVNHGLRPSFTDSAPPIESEPIFLEFVKYMKENYSLKIETGLFGAMMDVTLINDGPVTIIIDKDI